MLLLLLACADNKTPAPPSGTTSSTTGPTWTQDVAPIVQEHCARCHSPNQQAPDWFSDPANAQAMAAQMLASIDRGTMPPPAPNPDCRDYQGADALVLDDAERAVIAAWVEAGAPIGQGDADMNFVSPIATSADLELRPPAPIKPVYDETGNGYTCYAFDIEEDVFATGMVPLIDNPRILHHVVVYDGTSDDDLPAEGVPFECPGFGEDDWSFMAGWAPGGLDVQLPEGMGVRINAGTRIVLQLHYYSLTQETALDEDQSGYGFNTVDAVETEVFPYTLGVYNFRVPAGDADYQKSLRLTWEDSYPAIGVIGVFPHMHQLGSGFDMLVTHPDDTETCLVEMDGWDFHNQAQAFYTEPVRVEPGDKLTLTCHWDNSAENPAQFNDPPETIELGEGSHQEMCFGFTYGFIQTD